VRGRIDEGDRVLSALHDLPLEDTHVQAQRKAIFDAIEFENSQKPFNPVTLIWDNTGMLDIFVTSRCACSLVTELQAGRRLRIAFLILCLQQLMGR
jgi:hypothetical protein